MEGFNEAVTNKAQYLSQMIHCLNFFYALLLPNLPNVPNVPFFAIKSDAHFLISHTQTHLLKLHLIFHTQTWLIQI